MKGIINLILIFILSVLVIGSISITILDLINKRYFKEFENLKSLNDKEKYMIIDSLLIKQTFDRNENTDEGARFDIRGVLMSDKSILTLAVVYPEYIDFNLDYQPLYKSKLTGYYFLKDAPKKYYKQKYRAQYVGIFFKIAFYFAMPFLIYILIKHIRNRRYRI
jgi:hypothetical protein